MKNIHIVQLLFVAVLAGTAAACDKTENKKPEINNICVNDREFTASQAGYFSDDDLSKTTVIQFIYDDPIAAPAWQTIEIELPNTAIGAWYTLAQDGTTWRMMLDHVWVGNGDDMDIISSGKVYVNPLSNPFLSNKLYYRHYEVKMELILETGKTASVHYKGAFSRGPLWM